MMGSGAVGARGSNNNNNHNVITTPLLLTSLTKTEKRVAAVNMDGGITIETNQQSYPCVQIQVQNGNNPQFPLTLLLDTACSGFVLHPEVVARHNLPRLQTPVTMTSAGGTSAATGLSQIDRFLLDGSNKETFGPLPAAVQDIGALPHDLDGIIGLSILNQFAAVDLDFRQGTVSLYRTASDIPNTSSADSTGELVAEADIRMLGSLGIFTVPVFFGGRGPVQMLVDTGAACTLLN